MKEDTKKFRLYFCDWAVFAIIFLAPDKTAAMPIDKIIPPNTVGDVLVEMEPRGHSASPNRVPVFFGRIEKSLIIVNSESFLFEASVRRVPAAPTAPAATPKTIPPQTHATELQKQQNRLEQSCAAVEAKYMLMPRERKTCWRSARFRALQETLAALKDKVVTLQMSGSELWTDCANRISGELNRAGFPLTWKPEKQRADTAEITLHFCSNKQPAVAVQTKATPQEPTPPTTPSEADGTENPPFQESHLEGDVRIKFGDREISPNGEGWFVFMPPDASEMELTVHDSEGEKLRRKLPPQFYPLGYSFEKSHPSVTGFELVEVRESLPPPTGHAGDSEDLDDTLGTQRKTKGPLPALIFRPGYRPPRKITSHFSVGPCAAWSDVAASETRLCANVQADWPRALWNLNVFGRATFTHSTNSALQSTVVAQIDALMPLWKNKTWHLALDAGLGGYFFSSTEKSAHENKNTSQKLYVPKSYGYPYPVVALKSPYRKPLAWRLGVWAIPAYVPGAGLYMSYGSHLSATASFSETLGATLFAMSDAAALPVGDAGDETNRTETASARVSGIGLGISVGL